MVKGSRVLIKLIIRSSGEDIQNDSESEYGMNDRDSELISRFYKDCDIAW